MGRRASPEEARLKHPRIAFLLLVNAVLSNNLWKFFPEDSQAYVWHASLGLSGALCLAVIGLALRSVEVWLVVALAAGFCLQSAGCSIWFMLDPWTVKPGDELCSSGLQFPLGLIGLWASVCVALFLRGRYVESNKS